jgi:hypothetical protein
MRPGWVRALLVPMSMCSLGQAAIATDQQADRRMAIVDDGRNVEAEQQAIARAVRLLPRMPVRVALIDAREATPDLQTALLRLDAFVVKGSPTVYVVRQSELLKGARAGSAFHIHALAAVLWHEMAHADGHNEREARQREEALWTSFLRDQRIDPVNGLRYLSALTHRRDEEEKIETLTDGPDRRAMNGGARK